MEKKPTLHNSIETITALATPPGRGGIAIVRVSGPLVSSIMQHMLGKIIPPRQATVLPFLSEHKESIDEGVAVFFPGPNSFTGEDVLELQGHGGPVVVDLVLQRLLALGARLARPGEFSERAFLNGKLDLAQAEAIADLIHASSKQAAQSAIRSLQGEFSRDINVLNEKLIHLRMYIEAAIDFSDEEIDFLADEKLTQNISDIISHLSNIQNKAKQGSFLREGITAVIAGEPNVGKSSLLNCLSGKDVAIVTDIPGTTRDVLRDDVMIDGMPMRVIDTAGLRDSDDVVEIEGIRRAYQEMEQADLVLYVSDVRNPRHCEEPSLRGALFATKQSSRSSNPGSKLTNRPHLFIQNKIDLVQQSPRIQSEEDKTTVSLSVKTGEGIDLLKKQIKSMVGYESETDGVYLARRRHLDALSRAKQHVQASLVQLSQHRAGELAAEDLRLAQMALCEITGEFTADDLLGKIFSSFCIGK